MKKNILLSFIVLIVFACSRKTISTTAPETKTQSPSSEKADGVLEAPVIENNPISSEPIKQDVSQNPALVAGQRIYIVNCGRCHELPAADKFNAQRWDEILKKMIPKAKLNTQHGEQVKAYLVANAKK